MEVDVFIMNSLVFFYNDRSCYGGKGKVGIFVGYYGRDLRLWMVKVRFSGVVEVEMERLGGS